MEDFGANLRRFVSDSELAAQRGPVITNRLGWLLHLRLPWQAKS